MAYKPIRTVDPNLPLWKAILGMVLFFAGMGLLMRVLEEMPIEGLIGMLIAMFVIGFFIPQKKKVTKAIQQPIEERADCVDRSG